MVEGEEERIEKQVRAAQIAILCVLIVAAGRMYADEDSDHWEGMASETVRVIVALGRLRRSLLELLRRRRDDGAGLE